MTVSELFTVASILDRAISDLGEARDNLEHPSVLFANQDDIRDGVDKEIIGALDKSDEEDPVATSEYRIGFANGQKSVLPRANKAEGDLKGITDRRDKLRYHVDEVYDMLDARYSAAKHGSKAEKAIGEVLTFMEANPV